jgi:hypothetical protein
MKSSAEFAVDIAADLRLGVEVDGFIEGLNEHSFCEL